MSFNIFKKVKNMAKKETLKKPAKPKMNAADEAYFAERKAQFDFVQAAREAGATGTDKQILAGYKAGE
tara:strand:- start:77 stop:280 length:204 start_codon:yes stop_codon:yes gene_type:complete